MKPEPILDQRGLLTLLEGFHDARLLVLGDVMLDRFVYGSVERMSPEAPIPVMTVGAEVDVPGGAANVARNAASLGANAVLIGVVGDDVSARDLATQLARLPTIAPRLITDASRPTTVKVRFVAGRQQILRADREQRAPLADPVADRILSLYCGALPDADVVVLSDYAKGVLTDAVTHAAISAARAAGKPVIVDPKCRSFDKYAGATVLTPNRQEIETACGHPCGTDEQVESAARPFVDRGLCATMVVTRGAQGLSIVSADAQAEHLAAAAHEVFDDSGAGDTAIATLALGIAAGGTMAAASRLANVAAGLVVTKAGTAVVSTGEIAAALTQFGRAESGKLFAPDDTAVLVRDWRAQGLTVAFTNGCFDLLHPGHLYLLEQARRAVDRLVVGLNSDLSVRRLKGAGRPVQGEVARGTMLASLKMVDAVVIFPEDTPLRLIESLRPDVLVKGADYDQSNVVGADLVIGRGGRVLLAKLLTDQSTTRTIARGTAAARSS